MVNKRHAESGIQTSKRPATSILGDVREDRDASPKPVKKTRVSRACDQCRVSREKCDGSRPLCQACRSQDRECTYNEQPKKRGIQPNYIRTLELLVARSLQLSSGLEKDLVSDLPREHSVIHKLLSGKDPETAETLHQAWRDSIINRQVDQILSGATVEQYDTVHDLRAPGMISSHESGNAETPVDPLIRTSIQYELNPINTEVAHTGQAPCIVAGVEQPKRLTLPADAWTLLEYYFAFTHAWMPMTEKADMMKLMYAYPPEGLPTSQASTAEHAELWSLMAVASIQISCFDSRVNSGPIRKIAESLIPATGATYEVPHLKAMVLLALCDIQQHRTLDAWIRIGTVVRLLLLFNILNDVLTKWCRHLHLAAYLVESTLASHLNAPSHLTVAYVQKIGFIDEDGRDEWEPWQDPCSPTMNFARAPARSFSTFNKLVLSQMQHAQASILQSTVPRTSIDSNIVSELLFNAASEHGRLQPALYIENSQVVKSAVQARPLDQTKFKADSVPHAHRSMPQPMAPIQPFMSTYDDVTNIGHETVQGTSDSKSGDNVLDDLPVPEVTEGSGMFMQHLGFAADLDLQDFFGDAYQASDLISTYNTTDSTMWNLG